MNKQERKEAKERKKRERGKEQETEQEIIIEKNKDEEEVIEEYSEQSESSDSEQTQKTKKNKGEPTVQPAVTTIINGSSVPYITNFKDNVKSKIDALLKWTETKEASDPNAKPIQLNQCMGTTAILVIPLMFQTIQTTVKAYLDEKKVNKWEQLKVKDLVKLMQIANQISSQSENRDPTSSFTNNFKKFSYPMLNSTSNLIETVTNMDLVLIQQCGLGETFSTHPLFTTEFQKTIVSHTTNDGFTHNKICKNIQQSLKHRKEEILKSLTPWSKCNETLVQVATDVNNTISACADIFDLSVDEFLKKLGFEHQDKNSNQNKQQNKSQGNPSNKRSLENSEKKECNICGHKHHNANTQCLFFKHLDANKEKIPFIQSTNGKKYQQKFQKTKLSNIQTNGETFDYELAKKEAEKFKKPKGNCSKINCKCLLVPPKPAARLRRSRANG